MRNLVDSFRKLPGQTRAILETILAGVTGCLIAFCFEQAISRLYQMIWVPLEQGSVERFALVGLCVLTGVSLAGGLLLHFFAPEARGSGIPQLKVSYWRDMGVISWRVVWVKFVAGALAVGGGLSLGREGPTVQLAGGMASLLGGRLGLINAKRRTITACGAAAGLVAAFNTPIAAVTFVLEEVIEDLNSRAIGFLMLASFSSVFTLYLLQGDAPTFHISDMTAFHPLTYLASLPVGAVAALVGVAFQKGTLGWMARIKTTSRLPVWGRPVVGALITWAAATLVFGMTRRTGVLGLGYQDLNLCLQGELATLTILALLVAKFLATTASYAWGNCGGIFAPALFLGAMAGALCGKALGVVVSLNADDLQLLTVVGMSACLGAVVRAPVTSILIVFEMTHNFLLVPPLMMAALVSQVISRRLSAQSFYDQVLSDSGIEIDQYVTSNTLSQWKKRRAAQFATFTPKSVVSWKRDTISSLLSDCSHKAFPVLRDDGTVEGVVSRAMLEEFVRTGSIPSLTEAVCVSPGETLGGIQASLVEAPLNIVLLTSPEKRLLGLITIHDLLRSQMVATSDDA